MAIPKRFRMYIPEAAVLLGRTHFWVWSRALQGLIRRERIGARWVVDRRDVERFAAEQRRSPKPAA